MGIKYVIVIIWSGLLLLSCIKLENNDHVSGNQGTEVDTSQNYKVNNFNVSPMELNFKEDSSEYMDVDKEITVLDHGVKSGIFYDIVYGDYQHLILVNANNEYHDYFISNTISEEETMNLLNYKKENPEINILVFWRRIRLNIPEAGRVDTVDQVYKFKILNQ